jgi:hypothetical protein
MALNAIPRVDLMLRLRIQQYSFHRVKSGVPPCCILQIAEDLNIVAKFVKLTLQSPSSMPSSMTQLARRVGRPLAAATSSSCRRDTRMSVLRCKADITDPVADVS